MGKPRNPERLNKWRWYLLALSFILVIGAVMVSNHTKSDVWLIVLAFSCLGIVGGLGILLILDPKSVPRSFRIVLYVILGFSLIALGVYRLLLVLNFEIPIEWKWVISETNIVLYIGTLCLLFLSYFDRTASIIPWLVPAIIAGLVISRLVHEDFGISIVSLGFIFISVGSLREAIIARKLYRKRSFTKRLFIFVCILMVLCNAYFFFEFADYRTDRFDIVDLIGISFFFIMCLFLFISMPFSKYIEWGKTTKSRLLRLIIIPGLFLYLLIMLIFVLPNETYRKLLYKEYGQKTEYFGMKDYKVESPKE